MTKFFFNIILIGFFLFCRAVRNVQDDRADLDQSRQYPQKRLRCQRGQNR